MESDEESTRQNEDQMRVDYPKNDKNLVEFPHHCQKKKSEVTMFPGCSSVFDRKATENLERVRITRYR